VLWNRRWLARQAVAGCLLLTLFLASISAAAGDQVWGFQTVKPVKVAIGDAVQVEVTFKAGLPVNPTSFKAYRRTRGNYDWPAGSSAGSFSDPSYLVPLSGDELEVLSGGSGLNVTVTPLFAGENVFVAEQPAPASSSQVDVLAFVVYVQGEASLGPACLFALLSCLIFGSLMLGYTASERTRRWLDSTLYGA